MRHRRTRRTISYLITAILLFQMLTQTVTATPAPVEERDLAAAPATDAFQRTWARTDQPVASGQVSRTWMWGPEAFTGAMTEDYVPVNSNVVERQVQYFDKSRMEITDPDGDSSSIWYVTNGLLVRELMTGEMQVGDQEWMDRFPAEVNIAGDADDPDGPTYATFAEHSFPASTVSANEGTAVIQRINRAGEVTDDPSLSMHDVMTARYVSDTGHHVASVFWEFMRAEGTIYTDGEFTSGPLFPNEFYATGFPISEPYWTTVRVGGTPKDVLVQCFDRRCLTYTPDNPDGWQVEAGNVGQHYYAWRYETNETPDDVHRMAYIQRSFEGNNVTRTIYTMNSDGTDHRSIGLDLSIQVLELSLSPDGQRIAFTAWDEKNDAFSGTQVYTVNIDGSDLQEITELEDMRQPAYVEWSPDGTRIAFTSLEFSETGQQYQYLYVALPNGSSQQRLTGDGEWATYATWSPDGAKLVYTSSRNCKEGAVRCLWVINADGTGAEMVLQSDTSLIVYPDWSPDGNEILYMGWRSEDEEAVVRFVIVDADGNHPRIVLESPYAATPRWDPSGERIFFADRRDGNYDMFVIDRDGSNEQRLTVSEQDEFSPSPMSR